MKLKIFHEKLLSNLKSGILNNTELYFNDDFEYPNLNEDTRTLEDFNIEINALEPIINYQGSSDIKDRASSDADFSTIFYNAFRKIPPNLAKDERLWAYLTHTLFFNYTKARFDITRESSKKIKQHFFCFNGERGFERDNACSRLWWIGFIANRVDDFSIDKVVKAFLFTTDVRANLIERPSTINNINLFTAIIKLILDSMDEKFDPTIMERENFRSLMKEINNYGGTILLDTLDKRSLEDATFTLANKVIKNKKTIKLDTGS